VENLVNEDQIDPVIIDLGLNRRKDVSEQTFQQLGGDIKWMLGRMFKGAPINALFRGSRSEIDAFGKALYREKDYMNSYLKYGLNDARVYRDRYRLEKAIKGFERETGLVWPFN